ncbi:L,D-transpeptidase [Enterovirga sp.]|uniref:L,D-transpeptidase n=1 Tax=Enterovirga sp. TaxID=2026350 RepID=UPI002616A6E0|nr:L,D-transpeptidase [Enterovirga sp.]MDB5591323.1 hypothetical protein [Enterovirga sp.]
MTRTVQAIALGCALAFVAQPAWSQFAPRQQVQPGPYGGGFIELLITGREPGTAAARPAQAGRLAARTNIRPISGPDPFAEPDGSGPQRGMDPAFRRQVVSYPGPEAPGTIVVDTPSRFLYHVQPGGQAVRYGIGVGRPGFTWAGMKLVTQKREWPDWTPPPQMLARRPDLPRHMPGGPANPLGARALYLGSSLYRIHGTNEPHTIGQNVSSGCIRMMNEDVIDLYGRVSVGARVRVI